MRDFEKIGIVGGGQMGEALIRGILESELINAEKIMVAEPDADRRRYLAETYSLSVADEANRVADDCPILVMAVKPQILRQVLDSCRHNLSDNHLLISIAAGISIRSLEEWAGEDRKIIRVMPNTPALVLAGASALSANTKASTDDISFAMRIFSAIGTCLEVEEKFLDAVTGLSGSGPGYIFAFIEALIDGGILAGLPRQISEQLVLQTVYGAAKLAMESGEPPAVLRGKVTSPGGTTITGLKVLEEAGFRGAVMKAVQAAAARSAELGQ